MTAENKLWGLIQSKMKDCRGVSFGVAGTSWTEYSNEYKSALVIAVPHREILTLDNYSEERLEALICSAREEATLILSDLADLFNEHNIEFFIPPMAQKDEVSLMASFSFKYAAVRAGMGWIGKNGVLITKEYGPRVRLSCILLNCDLPAGTPVTQSECEDGCYVCVEACPYNALEGVLWNTDTMREELIDYHLCNNKRSQYLRTHGRKNACGICMAACPVGAEHK